jgi:hypothetical protein
MASTITLIANDDVGLAILGEFEDVTGLSRDGGDDKSRTYAIDGDDHRIRIVATLDDIDAGWTSHVAIGDPA